MRTMTILIESNETAARARMKSGFLRAARTRRYQGEVRSFESPAAMFRVFTPVRWSLIEHLQSLGPVSLRGLARSIERDVKSVHRDVQVLLREELVARDSEGRFYVPFDRIHAEFDMARAAA
jgi:predicted transcriptional regulator